ncbi:MAG TPA: cytochrome P450 [Glaciibacter sp.]|nr:cytochrome P450 [Glaciibacter sp.]
MTHTAIRETGIPRLPTLDSTVAFLRDGYTFGERQFERSRGDAFRTRLFGLPVIVARGADAAALFTQGEVIARERTVPASLKQLLRNPDRLPSGEAGRQRQQLRERMLGDAEELGRLREFFAEEWRREIDTRPSTLTLSDGLADCLVRTAIRWVGSVVDGPDVVRLDDGPRADAWARSMIADVRAERRVVARSSVLRQITDSLENGQPLSDRDAADELLRVMRAVAGAGRLVAFVALALHRHPLWRDRFSAGVADSTEAALDADIGRFVAEIQRFYPLAPMASGRVLSPFRWRGQDIGAGTRILLDVYGTNHDASVWDDPHQFRPERFEATSGDGSSLAGTGHAVEPGFPEERMNAELMKEAVGLLTRETDYTVPDQDLRVSLKRFPSVPESGFIIANPTPRAAN